MGLFSVVLYSFFSFCQRVTPPALTRTVFSMVTVLDFLLLLLLSKHPPSPLLPRLPPKKLLSQRETFVDRFIRPPPPSVSKPPYLSLSLPSPAGRKRTTLSLVLRQVKTASSKGCNNARACLSARRPRRWRTCFISACIVAVTRPAIWQQIRAPPVSSLHPSLRPTSSLES